MYQRAVAQCPANGAFRQLRPLDVAFSSPLVGFGQSCKISFTPVKITSYPLVEDRAEDGRATQQQGRTEKEVAAAGRKLEIHQQAADADAADAGADL